MAAAVNQAADPISAKRAHHALLGVFFLLVATVAGLTYYYLATESDSIKREAREELSIIADMKAKQIAAFLEDRKAGLLVIQKIELNVDAMERLAGGSGTPSDRNRISAWLEAMRKSRRYASIVLADARGRVALQIGHEVNPDEVAGFVRQTLQRDLVALQDFHRDPATGAPELAFGLPLHPTGGGSPFGVLIVSIDPSDSFYPTLQTWPTASESGEALLVRRDPDGVTILNSTRRGQDPAMTIRIPLSRGSDSAVLAAEGAEGDLDALDYRGVPVFATARRIVDAPWSLVTEIDREEVQQRLARRFFPAAFAAISLVLAAAAAVALLWRRQQARFYRDLYHAEVERKALADRYGFLSRFANDMILLADENSRIIEANDRAVDAYGYSKEEMLRMRLPDLWYPSEEARMTRMWAEIAERGPMAYETLHRRRDGSAMPVEVSARAVEVDGRIFSQNIIRDITERRAMDARLLQSEERFRKVAESAPEGIIVENESRILYANPVAVRLLGLESESALLSRSMLDFVEPADREVIRGRSARVADGDTAGPAELTLTGVGGRTFPAEVSAGPIQFDQRPCALVFFHDITERKRAEAERTQLEGQLLQAQRLESVGRLAGGVAHDFNNYLTVINGYSDKLCAEMDASHPLRETIEEIRAAGERAAAVTSQLLAFSRKQTVSPEPVSLNFVVTGSEKMLRRLIGEDIEIVTRLDADSPVVMADPRLLHQVLMNLAVNARDAMPDGGRLIVETTSVPLDETHAAAHAGAAPGRFALLTVSDTGVGMTAETMQKIFEPFFTTKQEGKGTGLGLATAYGIVRQAGGWIEVESEPGKGARFGVYLPRTERAPARAVEEVRGPAARSGNETILVVEDRPDVRRLALAILKPGGYKLLEAGGGAEALAVSDGFSGSIDLLLTDVIMPGMNGRELAARMRERRPSLKVLYISGYADSAPGSAETSGLESAFLAKPFTAVQLSSRVREMLGSVS